MASENRSVVLEEHVDSEYEPTEQEILDYSEWLGMDAENDKDLMWIARAGLKVPLPAPWKPCTTGEENEVFYFNFETGESVWDHPCDEFHRLLYKREKARKLGEDFDEAQLEEVAERLGLSTTDDMGAALQWPMIRATALGLGALIFASKHEATKAEPFFATANATEGALRTYLQSRFGTPSSVLPAKGDPALDPCPVLNEWPSKLEIDTPSPCTLAPSGSWTTSEASPQDSGIPLVMTWTQQCSTLGGGLVPVTSYTLPSGGLFGSTQPVASLTGNTFRLNDCVGYTRFFLDEKVYHVPGEPDAHACEIYGSCDGSVFLQFIIRDHAGRKIAHTPYLRLFQSSFNIEDVNGLLVAQVERIGRWNPMSKTCSGQAHKWLVKFPDLGIPGASALFPTAADRWPVAELVTIMSTRDGARLPSGLVGPSVCEMEKTGLLVVSSVFLVAAIGAVWILFVRVGVTPTQLICLDFEASYCPRRKRTTASFPKYTV